MTAIRLAHFVDSMEVGGSELNAIRTLERLDRSRFDLTVFHLGSQGPLLERYRALGIPLVQVALKSFKDVSALYAGASLVRELRHRRIQILHSHDIYSNIFSIPWARFAGVPVVIASKRWLGAIPSRAHGRANRIANRLATTVLANSEAVARSLIDEEGLSESKVRVISNFVGPEAFEAYPNEHRTRWLSSLGIQPADLVIGVVARLDPVKGHAYLLRAVHPVLQRYPSVHLVLLGDGPIRAELEASVARDGLASRVHFAGTVANIPNPHGALDISVLPSLSEGFPNSVIEAMAASRPVIATSVGGTPEAVRDGITGLLVPPGDDQALAASLDRLIGSPGLRQELGEAGRERAIEEYHVDVVIKRLSVWYDELLRVR